MPFHCQVHYVVRQRQWGLFRSSVAYICTVCGAVGEATKEPARKEAKVAMPPLVDVLGGPTTPAPEAERQKQLRFFLATPAIVGEEIGGVQLARLDAVVGLRRPPTEATVEGKLFVTFGGNRYPAKALDLAFQGETLKAWVIDTPRGKRIIVRGQDIEDAPEVIGLRGDSITDVFGEQARSASAIGDVFRVDFDRD